MLAQLISSEFSFLTGDLHWVNAGNRAPSDTQTPQRALVKVDRAEVAVPTPGRLVAMISNATVQSRRNADLFFVVGYPFELTVTAAEVASPTALEIPIAATVALRIIVRRADGRPAAGSPLEVVELDRTTGIITDDRGLAVWLAAPGRYSLVALGNSGSEDVTIGEADRGTRDVVLQLNPA